MQGAHLVIPVWVILVASLVLGSLLAVLLRILSEFGDLGAAVIKSLMRLPNDSSAPSRLTGIRIVGLVLALGVCVASLLVASYGLPVLAGTLAVLGGAALPFAVVALID